MLGWCAALVPRACPAQPSLPDRVPATSAIRLRIAWGGGQPARWQGELRLTSGQFEKHRSLGMKSRAAAVHPSSDVIRIRSSRPIAYEAFDVTIRAAKDAKLLITLSQPDSTTPPTKVALPVSELYQQQHNQVLDDDGNRLLIQRSPGDQLQVVLDRDHLVFSPGETWIIDVRPTRTPIRNGSFARLTTQVISRSTRRSHHKAQYDLRPRENGELPSQDRIEIPIPETEGVYELIVAVDEQRSASLFQGTTRVERAIQFVVVSSRVAKANVSDEWRQVLEFNPAQPRWWESLTRIPTWDRLPLSARGKVGEGDARPWQHQGRLVNRLQPGQRQSYPLPVTKVGVPYILEVECPAGAPQALSISIVEPELESSRHVTGVAVESNPISGGNRDTVRLIFWPRTRLPYLMLENVGDTRSASFEAIRLLAGPEHLPTNDRHRPAVGYRQALAYFGSPTYPQLFSASQTREESSGRQLTDWWTFWEGSQRFVEYLRYAGYTGAAVGAFVDGSSIFPAPALDPGSRFDTGAYFNNGQDPIQKDALELLFRLFDRERLQLVPVIRLSAPIPQLERLAAAQPDAGIRLVDRQGQPFVSEEGFALYNPLEPEVQATIASVVQIVIDRYAHHESFAGICLELGPQTFVQLPGSNWGFDRATIERFSTQSQLSFADLSDDELRRSLREGALRERWDVWRASQITAMYQKIAGRLVRSRSDARLYLATAKLIDSQAMHEVYHPVLRPRKKFDQAMLEMGLDFVKLSADQRIRISRPYCDVASSPLLRQADALELAASEETDRRYRQSGERAVQAFTRNRRVKWSEPGADAAASQVLHSARVATSVSGAGRRARLMESLAALDANVLIDGSDVGSTALADQVQRQMRIFSHLPAEPFEIVPAEKETTETADVPGAGPLVVRQHSHADRTFVYAVNVSAWPIEATIRVAAPDGTRLRPLCDACPPSEWNATKSEFLWHFKLDPYGLQAAVLSGDSPRVTDVQTEIPLGIGPMLQAKLAELVVRVGQLKQPPPLSRLVNAGFESVGGAAAAVPSTIDGWESSVAEGSSVQPDLTVRRKGNTSMRLASVAPVTWARSRRFAPPKTGRISVQVWVRSTAGESVPPLRLAIEGRLRDQPYYRYASIKDAEKGTSADTATGEWKLFVLHVDDLPSLDLDYLQVRFDLMGQGTVWLDDVSVYGASFTREEHHELSRIIAAADLQLREGRITACAKTLQRYWPRLLAEQFPMEPRLTKAENVRQNRGDERSRSPLQKIRKLVPRIRRLH
jgi:hypothetical protein